MSYYNPKYYNKENLKREHLVELDFWESTFKNLIRNEEMALRDSSGSDTFDKIREELIDDFCESLLISLGHKLQEVTVSLIDGYEDIDVQEREQYTTFLVEDKDDDEDAEGCIE